MSFDKQRIQAVRVQMKKIESLYQSLLREDTATFVNSINAMVPMLFETIYALLDGME